MTDEDRINQIMDWFDFRKVYNAMMALEWTWGGEYPCEAELREQARKLLNQLVKDKQCATIGTGGFEAYRDNEQLGLRFIVCDWFVTENEEDVEELFTHDQ